MTFWKKVTTPLLLVGLASPMLVNCDLLGGLPGVGCPSMKDGNFADVKFEGDADVQGKIKAFMEATYNLDKLAVRMETDLIASCTELGKAIGVDEAELTAEASGGDGAKKSCGAVSAKIDATFSANANIELGIEIGAPVCEVPIEAMNKCLEGCGAVIDPGELEASCEGGEISGSCSAECSGTCVIEAGAECGGKCNGVCNGKCDGEDSDGACAGTCEGECSATCEVEGKADCSGTCRGGCSAEMKAPSCTGTYKPPSVDAECHANCVANTAGDIKCSPPQAIITVNGEANADINVLVKGLEVALPKIVNIQLGTAKAVAGSVESLVTTAAEIPEAAVNAGLSAVTCVGMAAEMAISASASISVNVSVSASVSASASGEASGEAGGEAG